VQQRPRLREGGGRQRRPARAGAAQVHRMRGRVGMRTGLLQVQREPGQCRFVQPEEARAVGKLRARRQHRVDREVRRVLEPAEARVAFAVDQQQPGPRPVPAQGIAVVAEVFGAVEAGMLERVLLRRRGHARRCGQTEKLLPQPQVDFAFGLRITNCAPCRFSR
jgi:hypothetical protein